MSDFSKKIKDTAKLSAARRLIMGHREPLRIKARNIDELTGSDCHDIYAKE